VLLVDSVSGIAGTPVESDGWNLDFVLTGSQKALALPPGLAFGVAQESVLARAKQRANRGVYFDFIEFEKGIAKDQTPNTPALSLLYALALQLQRIREETIEGRWARHEAMARRTVEWTAEMRERGVALSLLAPEGYRSPTVSCIKVPEGGGQSGSRITKEMDRLGFTIAAGEGREGLRASAADSSARLSGRRGQGSRWRRPSRSLSTSNELPGRRVSDPALCQALVVPRCQKVSTGVDDPVRSCECVGRRCRLCRRRLTSRGR